MNVLFRIELIVLCVLLIGLFRRGRWQLERLLVLGVVLGVGGLFVCVGGLLWASC